MKYRIFFLLLLPISFIFIQVAKYSGSFAEYYALNIYPKISASISFITSKIPFSLAEFILIFLIILILIYSIRTIVLVIRDKSLQDLSDFSLNIISFVSVMVFLFVIICGVNYYRYQFSYYSNLEIKKSSKQELIMLSEKLIVDANKYRSNTSKDETAVLILNDNNFYETARRAQSSFDTISNEYSVLKGSYPPPKPVFFSEVMSYGRITGVFFPYTFESNINVHVPEHEIPSTMLHELVHLRGFMREDEANFISYLACINSGYDDFAYSGTLLALNYTMNELYKEDYEEFARLYEKYSEGVKLDLSYSYDYWKKYETKVAEISHKVNDSYLKINNQTDGAKSYGRMVDLLLAYYR